MKQRRQRLDFDNLDEVLSASKTSKRKGTQQFETPLEIAAALAIALLSSRPVIADFQCGHGALLEGAAITTPKQDTRLLLGMDIDPTASIGTIAGAKVLVERRVLKADCTKLWPLLIEAKVTFDLLVSNPPFSLKWNMEKCQPPVSRPSEFSFSKHTSGLSDSTLATFEAMHRLLTKRGEGLMICNHDICLRLLETSPLWSKTWLKLVMPNFFDGVLSAMEIAVVYFAASHRGKSPVVLRVPDAVPDTIRRIRSPVSARRKALICGPIVEREWDALRLATKTRFDAVCAAWKRLTDKARAACGGWNIWLDRDGTIRSYVTPFQTLSGKVPVNLAEALKGLENSIRRLWWCNAFRAPRWCMQ